MNDYDVIAFGGECSHWACIPSKTMMLPGEAVHGARKAAANAELDGSQHLVEGRARDGRAGRPPGRWPEHSIQKVGSNPV